MAQPGGMSSRGVTVRRWIASLLGAVFWGYVACLIGSRLAWRFVPDDPRGPRLILDLLISRPILRGWGQILCCLGCAALACGVSLWLARPWVRFGGGPPSDPPPSKPT